MAGKRRGPAHSDALLTVCIVLYRLQRCSQLILRLSGAEGKRGHSSPRTAFLGGLRVFPRTAEQSGFISEACFELWISRGLCEELCQSGLSAAALHILRRLCSSRTTGRQLRPRQRQRRTCGLQEKEPRADTHLLGSVCLRVHTRATCTCVCAAYYVCLPVHNQR